MLVDAGTNTEECENDENDEEESFESVGEGELSTHDSPQVSQQQRPSDCELSPEHSKQSPATSTQSEYHSAQAQVNPQVLFKTHRKFKISTYNLIQHKCG